MYTFFVDQGGACRSIFFSFFDEILLVLLKKYLVYRMKCKFHLRFDVDLIQTSHFCKKLPFGWGVVGDEISQNLADVVTVEGL